MSVYDTDAAGEHFPSRTSTDRNTPETTISGFASQFVITILSAELDQLVSFFAFNSLFAE
jgi:hypothetical protein